MSILPFQLLRSTRKVLRRPAIASRRRRTLACDVSQLACDYIESGLAWVLALSEAAPLALLVSTVPVAVPEADPVALTVSVVLTVSVETWPVSGPVFTFAWFLEQAASEAAATKAKSKRIAYPSFGVPAGYCRVAHERLRI